MTHILHNHYPTLFLFQTEHERMQIIRQKKHVSKIDYLLIKTSLHIFFRVVTLYPYEIPLGFDQHRFNNMNMHI